MKRIYIRREDKNEWEKRVPLIPEDCRKITSQVRVLVEPSSQRCFCDQEYAAAGCLLCSDPMQGDIVMGIKEIPPEKILPGKIYMMFSHCVKGQPGGIRILEKIMERGGMLIDYEKITDDGQKRLIGFSRFAGYAGTMDALWMLGKLLSERGITSAFQELKSANEYGTLEQAKNALEKLKKGHERAAKTDWPVIIGVLGNGNIAGGVKEILNQLPVTWVEPKEIEGIYKNQKSGGRLYACIFWLKDIVEHKETKTYGRKDFFSHPEEYASRLGAYLRYLTVVINGLYWVQGNPHMVTWDMLRQKGRAKHQVLLLIDIANDQNGTFECNIKYTGPAEPCYFIDPDTQKATENKSSIAVMAAENFPAEFSTDASVYFSKKLTDYIVDIAAADYERDFEELQLPEELKRAVIVYQGRLTPAYGYLEDFIKDRRHV